MQQHMKSKKLVTSVTRVVSATGVVPNTRHEFIILKPTEDTSNNPSKETRTV
jgi:hypothetical protein